MKILGLSGEYFYGNKVSDYGIENGYLDYATLAKSFNCVLNNSIMQKTCDIGFWERISGFIDNSEQIEELEELENQECEIEEELIELREELSKLEEEQDREPEILQYFIVSDSGASILQDCDEIVFYNEELDMYVWSVTHWGTSWDSVLTDIKINVDADK